MDTGHINITSNIPAALTSLSIAVRTRSRYSLLAQLGQDAVIEVHTDTILSTLDCVQLVGSICTTSCCMNSTCCFDLTSDYILSADPWQCGLPTELQ